MQSKDTLIQYWVDYAEDSIQALRLFQSWLRDDCQDNSPDWEEFQNYLRLLRNAGLELWADVPELDRLADAFGL